MKTYELTYIISSALTLHEAEDAVKEVESFIQSKEGVILKSEKSTAQTLAYPIKKQHSGYFVTTIFQAAEEKMKEIHEKLEKDKHILRHLILIKKPVKEMKERRTRKPSPSPQETPGTSAYTKPAEDKKKGEKVQMEEIEKKLDEILSE